MVPREHAAAAEMFAMVRAGKNRAGNGMTFCHCFNCFNCCGAPENALIRRKKSQLRWAKDWQTCRLFPICFELDPRTRCARGRGFAAPGNESRRQDMRIVAITLLAAAAASAALLALDEAPGVADDVAAQSFTQIEDISSLNGAWRSRGYGWLVEFRDGKVRFFDESASLCAVNASLPDAGKLAGQVRISTDATLLRLPVNDPSYLHTFDLIDALPEYCGSAHDAAPRAVLDAMIEAFSTHYVFFDERNVEWQELADASRRELTPDASETRLLGIMGDLVAEVDDAHVSLEAEVDGDQIEHYTGAGRTLTRLEEQAGEEGIGIDAMYERWEDGYWERDVAKVLLEGEGVRTGDDLITYGLIGDNIGYIAVLAMTGFSGDENNAEADIAALDRAMENAMTLFSGVDAVIVDVSINWGGYDTVARALAGRFAEERTVGYYKYAGDAKAAPPQAIHVEPSQGRRFTGPVYLVTSNVTLSAAEILTMSMRALPNVTHIGETTRGALSDILTKPLPNGWRVSLSNEVYLDHEGRGWEGAGIPPEQEMTIFSEDDVRSGHVEAIHSIVEKINKSG
jgi:carboxyl-terminal processing protease